MRLAEFAAIFFDGHTILLDVEVCKSVSLFSLPYKGNNTCV